MANDNQSIDLQVPDALDESTPLPRTYFEASMPEKKRWPELEGLTAEEAEKKIKEEMAGADVRVVPKDSFMTMDFRTNRVRIFVDSSNKVVGVPAIG